MEHLSWENNAGMHIHAVHWPARPVAAVITLVHGQGEHIGRYDHLARWYADRGIAVVGFDHQGYGKSAGKRGHAKNLDAFLDGIEQASAETRRLYPGVPHFLYGHSMGGHLALNYMLRRMTGGENPPTLPQLAGVIATGPWIRLAFPTPVFKLMLGRLLYRFIPALSLPSGLVVPYLSHDPAVVQAFLDDPHVHFRLSLAAGIGLLDGANWLNRFRGAAPVPVLLQHGGGDKITSAPATRELAGRLQGDVTYREWPGFYHEIHNEPEKETVFQFTLDWMSGIISRRS